MIKTAGYLSRIDKKALKQWSQILTAAFLLITFNSSASQAFTSDSNILVAMTNGTQSNPAAESLSSKTLSRTELESIIAKVVSLDINVDRDQKSYLVRCLGSLSNRSNLILKNIKLTIQLMDSNKNLIEEIQLDYIDRAEPGQEKPFKLEKFINTKSSPYEIRAKATVSEAEKTDTMQVAQWFLDGRMEMLKYWDIPYNEKDFQNGSLLRDSAIKVLTGIRPNDTNYQKAMAMVNELRYTEGLINLSAADYANGFINLIAVSPESKFSSKAEKLIDLYRPRTVFEKAKSLYPKKDYLASLSLLRTIPPNNEFYFEAQQELKKLNFLSKKVNFKKNSELSGFSEDQIKVLQLMENKPEIILNDSPAKNQTIWVYSDYSHFNFDESGKLLKFKIYPLL